jgi:hypothetical protein
MSHAPSVIIATNNNGQTLILNWLKKVACVRRVRSCILRPCSEQWISQTASRANLKLARNGERKTHEERTVLVLKADAHGNRFKRELSILAECAQKSIRRFSNWGSHYTTLSLSKYLLYFHSCLLTIYMTGYWLSLKREENIFALIVSRVIEKYSTSD